MTARAASNDRVNEHVEFVVKAAEELILEGSERTIIRVPAGTPYSCLMLKNQRFSSLFRHYAKHHGLRRDDLAYYFTEELRNEDTPETVFLQARDEIIVRKRRKEEVEDNPPVSISTICPNDTFLSHIASLRQDDEHMDVKFFVGVEKEVLAAHKAILVARSDYFRGMFRRGMRESGSHTVEVLSHDVTAMRKLLEFIYTNRVADLDACSYTEVMQLLSLADEYLMYDLKALCEHTVRESLDVNNVAKLLEAAEDHSAEVLKKACIDFIKKNMEEVCNNSSFEQQITSCPSLSLSILKALSKEDGNTLVGRSKKRKRSEGEGASIVNS